MMNKNGWSTQLRLINVLNTPLPGDDASVQLMTVYEAQKCQAIINGYLDGLLGYEEGVRKVAFLLLVARLLPRESRMQRLILLPGRSNSPACSH